MEKRTWHLVDVEGQILGRVSTRIARLLMGKDKPVVVINASKIRVTGKKETDKVYYRHSGYPGGLRSETLGELRKRRPEEIIRRAVRGMLPKNKLQKERLKRLQIFAEAEHPLGSKFGGGARRAKPSEASAKEEQNGGKERS